VSSKLGNEGAQALPAHQQAFLSHLLKRLADHRAAYAKETAQLGLGGDSVARPPGFTVDLRFEGKVYLKKAEAPM